MDCLIQDHPLYDITFCTVPFLSSRRVSLNSHIRLWESLSLSVQHPLLSYVHPLSPCLVSIALKQSCLVPQAECSALELKLSR